MCLLYANDNHKMSPKRILVVYKEFLTGYTACRSCTAELGVQFTEKTIGPQVQPYKVDLFLTRVLGFSLLLRLESLLAKHGSLGFSSQQSGVVHALSLNLKI